MVLKLEDDCYYVGMTSYKGAIVRYAQHCNGTGAKWTKLHKPVELFEVRDIGYCPKKMALSLENQMTREYMSKYSMYRVRGGDLCYKSDTEVSLHFNDHTPQRSHVKKSKKYLKLYDKIQRDIASELSWIL